MGELSGGRLALRVPSVPADGESVKRSLNRWYASQAEGVFAASMARCLPRCAAFVQCAPPLKARFLRARWGSWSSARGILLNTHLLKAPPECIDYVLLHELCHTVHPDHGRGFYSLLESVLPEWKDRRKELRERAKDLLFV